MRTSLLFVFAALPGCAVSIAGPAPGAVAPAEPPVAATCHAVAACVDGDDTMRIVGGALEISHGKFEPMGMHPDCAPALKHQLVLDGASYPLDAGKPARALPVDITTISSISAIRVSPGGGTIRLDSSGTVVLDDDLQAGPHTFAFRFCGPTGAS